MLGKETQVNLKSQNQSKNSTREKCVERVHSCDKSCIDRSLPDTFGW